jgi:transposase-like protein
MRTFWNQGEPGEAQFKLIAATVLATAGIAAAVWAALGPARTDPALSAPSITRILADAKSPDEARQALAKQFGVEPSSLKLDQLPVRGGPGPAQNAHAPGTPADAPERAAPIFRTAASDDDAQSLAALFEAAVAQSAARLPAMGSKPTSTAAKLARAAAATMIAPLRGVQAAVDAFAGLDTTATDETRQKRSAFSTRIASLFASAQIDPAQVVVEPADPAAGPMPSEAGPGARRPRSAMNIMAPNIFPAVAKFREDHLPCVEVRCPVQFPDGAGHDGSVEIGVIFARPPAADDWFPVNFKLYSQDPALAMRLAKALGAGAGTVKTMKAGG